MRYIFPVALVTILLGWRSAFAGPDDFNANTEDAAAALQRWQNWHHRWHTTGWWNAANCVEAMENVIVADNGQKYANLPAKVFRDNRRKNFLNDYYDDEGWWALAWIRAYDLTGDPRYLDMAKTIFDDLKTGWTDTCGGGMTWRKNHIYKNAIPNELFLLAAIRLHQRTPGDGGPDGYLGWALKEWNWFKNSGLINFQNLVNDGLGDDCENNGATTWTYNQGVVVGGLTDLYKSTGDTNYLNEAKAIADATLANLTDQWGILRDPCEVRGRGCGGGDVPQFKGIFIRYLAYLYDETHDPDYLYFLRQNEYSIWHNDRNEANQLGLRWSGPFDAPDAARQSSAMMAISALAEPMTQTLPFARGAGSPACEHGEGAASGTLAWTCTATNVSGTGLMLATSCTLPGRKHVVHFHLALDEIKQLPKALAQLEVTTADGKPVASRPIFCSSFTASHSPQDFALAYRNPQPGRAVIFRIYWNHFTNAPALTASDVIADGYQSWTAANLEHEIGRLDGWNNWEADPLRDPASGCLVSGRTTENLPAGHYNAGFELKVDNFNGDKSAVADLSVVEAESGRVIAARVIRRDQFPNTLYQTFNLPFKAEADKHYGFHTYWHHAPTAPRLTQRSLTVTPVKAWWQYWF